jgi:hypothetical protein
MVSGKMEWGLLDEDQWCFSNFILPENRVGFQKSTSKIFLARASRSLELPPVSVFYLCQSLKTSHWPAPQAILYICSVSHIKVDDIL